MNLDTILWFSSCVVEAALVGLLLYRRAWRAFPLFLSYNAWSLIGSLAAVVVLDKYRSSYTTWYLVETVLDSTLLFGVLIELAWSILRPVRASLSRRALIPVIGLILALGAAVWPFASLSGVAGASEESYFIAHLLQTVSILQIIFFFVLIASSQLLSIGWRDRELQVATGLGLFSLASIATAMLQMHQTSYIEYRHLVRIEIGGYICSLVYWIVCFVQQEAARREFTPQMRGFLLAAAGAARSNRVALTESQMVKPRKDDQ